MSKRVLDVGNCGPDHSTVTQVIRANFEGVTVDKADHAVDALEQLAGNDYKLVMVNRLLDVDGSPGMDVIESIQKAHSDTPVMLITNFEDHQSAAVEAGCVPGFGKRDVSSNATVELLATYLR